MGLAGAADAHGDRGVSQEQTGKLRRRLLGYCQGYSRRPPPFYEEIELARLLNGYLGTQLAPWEWGAVPDVWIAQVLIKRETEQQLAEVNSP